MIRKHIAIALVGFTAATGAALAQTTPPANAPATTNPPAVTPTTPPSTTDTMTKPSTTAVTPSATSGSTASSANWMTTPAAGQWRASKLDGVNVYNSSDEKIGEIDEILLGRDGKASAAVISVGGFLGIGEHHVAVPFDQIQWVDTPRTASTTNTTGTGMGTGTATTGTRVDTNATGAVANDTANMNRGYPDHAMLNMTKDQLKAAPEFKYTR